MIIYAVYVMYAYNCLVSVHAFLRQILFARVLFSFLSFFFFYETNNFPFQVKNVKKALCTYASFCLRRSHFKLKQHSIIIVACVLWDVLNRFALPEF